MGNDKFMVDEDGNVVRGLLPYTTEEVVDLLNAKGELIDTLKQQIVVLNDCYNSAKSIITLQKEHLTYMQGIINEHLKMTEPP